MRCSLSNLCIIVSSVLQDLSIEFLSTKAEEHTDAEVEGCHYFWIVLHFILLSDGENDLTL